MNRYQARTVLLSSLIFLVRFAYGQSQAAPSAAPCTDAAYEAAEILSRDQHPEKLTEALALYQQALNCQPNSLGRPRKAEIFLGIGRTQLSLARYEEALASLRSSVELFAQIEQPGKALYLGKQAAALLHEALALRSLQKIDEALEIYSQAQALFHTVGNKLGESRTLGDLCHINFLMGDYGTALKDCHAALSLTEEFRPDKSTDGLKAYLLDLLGRIYFQMNDLTRAQSKLETALALARKRDYQLFIALTLNDLGLLALKQERPEIARDRHLDALNRFRKYEPANTDGVAETRCYLADAQRALGEYETAIRNYQEALSLQKTSGDAIGEAQTRVSLGLTEMELHHPEIALQSLARAVELYHRVSERAGEATARFQMAKILDRQGVELTAADEANQAISLAEEMRNFTPVGLRIPEFASLEEMYRFQIDVILKKDQISSSDQARSFDLVQRARARALLDLLQNRIGDNQSSCGQDLSFRWKLTVDKLRSVTRKLRGQLASGAKDSVLQETLIVIKDLETSRDEIESECEMKQPRLALFSSPAMSFAEIQDELIADEDSVFVQFYLAEPYSHAWVIAKRSVSVVRLPAADFLETQVNRTLKFGRFGEWTESQRKALDDLYNGLTPVFRIARSKRWIVVPDGVLHRLPFGLFSLKAPWLKQVVKVPSASAIRAVRAADVNRHPSHKVAVFADPVFDAQDSRVTKAEIPGPQLPLAVLPSAAASQSGTSYPRLLYSRQEADAIANLLLQGQVVSFLDFAAKLSAAEGNALRGFRIVHFSTHSVVDDRRPDLSRIVFSLVTKDGRPQPGYLLQKDIYRMRLNSDLVVLSSCRSAAGSSDIGEGLLSLSRAFLYAGSKAVLASSWAVDDEATATMMTRFYRHVFRDKLSPIEALARAQAEFRRHKNQKLRNPLYWVGFELYGDWHTSDPYEMF
jgi:CHAT domain-containing protein/tetratricopeptide (TPR) repeat protein